MGEKGNITSEELAAVTSAGGGAVVAGAGTAVTAVFEDAASSIKDKVIDKGTDAGITTAEGAWKRRHPDDTEPGAPQVDTDPPED